MSMLAAVATGAVFGAAGALLGTAIAAFARAPENLKGRIIGISVAVAAVASQPFARSIVEPWLATFDAERQIEKLPTFAVIKEHYPEDHARIRAKLRAALAAGADPISGSNSVRAELGPIVERALPRADAANTVALMELVRDEARAIRAISREECGRFITTGASSVDLAKTLGPELAQRDLKVTAAFLKQSATAPHEWKAQISADQLDAVVARAIQRVGPEDRNLVERWAQAGAPDTDLAANCSFSIALFEEILTLPRDDAAAFFQALMKAG